MKRYSIIANCQGKALELFLNTNKYFLEKYELIKLDPIHRVTRDEIDNFYKNIQLLDLIIIQPISDNYNNYHKYSTKSILSNIKSDCVVIMFPSLYFAGYYPNVIHDYIKSINITVHDINIIKQFIYCNNKQIFVNKCKLLLPV